MASPYGGYAYPGRSNCWQDWANLILAIWLFISPWILNFGAGNEAGAVAAWNAWVLAVVVFLVALSAIGEMQLWQEWVTLILGAWIFAAPWALGFTGLPAASGDHWVVGALIFLISLLNLTAGRGKPTGALPPGNRVP
ncbi:MAG TPA: SPW repeat protein [Stellaceae bacterium]|nr:SPW repeat protein [Stellaceae bacterium]